MQIVINQSEITKKLLTGIRAHSGKVGDKDILFLLEPTFSQDLSQEQGVGVLYELAKLTGKGFSSWQPVEIDLNFNQTGIIKVFQKHFDPYTWSDEIVQCTPNDKLIEYVLKRYK